MYLLRNDDMILSSNWVCVWKVKADGTKRAKARLVILGFEDWEKERVSRDAPTLSHEALRLKLSIHRGPRNP